MAVDVLLGLQWGDEGKGKVVDFLAPKYQVVARFQGGPNAGHTLEFEGNKHVLHQIPSGIFHDTIHNVIGNGVVLDPIIFQKEIHGLAKYQIDFSKNLFISKKAQIILPSHKLLDKALEDEKGKEKIGSTLKGIGPVYQDKIGRAGLRVGDILSNDFKTKFNKLKSEHHRVLKYLNIPFEENFQEEAFFEAVEFMKEFNLIETEYFLADALRSKKEILAEGAQGSLLDVDFGSYPFVTSSNTTIAGVCSGLGVPPSAIREVYGIFKAYCTRVGGGPFPTELFDADGDLMRDTGGEYGSTTGRPRRCGWIDIPALKYACMLNGVTQLFMMKADVLSVFDTIQAGVEYKGFGDQVPFDLATQDIKVRLEEFEGWKDFDFSATRQFDDFPSSFKQYIQFLEDRLSIPINLVSFGPDRKETVQKALNLAI